MAATTSDDDDDDEDDDEDDDDVDGCCNNKDCMPVATLFFPPSIACCSPFAISVLTLDSVSFRRL